MQYMTPIQLITSIIFYCLVSFASPSYAQDVQERVKMHHFSIHLVSGLRTACEEVAKEQEKQAFDPRAYGLCYGYVKGVKDSYDLVSGAQGTGNICFPYNITWLELIQAFLTWSYNTPEMSDTIAWTGLVTAWSEAFDCG